MPAKMVLTFKRTTYNCPYSHKCGCYVAFSVKECSDRITLLQAGTHDPKSHLHGQVILSVKQRGAVERAVVAIYDINIKM